ncbi:precorrin-6y C5,15-methyltransferase (decarboxylating) subunit CbiE [Aeromicrobium chenweiae]|uniref:Cobalamin biosynthesis bifunctional protein CbiET n=1 Tax=Aeromicrobium chenweiae TaxID=2079793 RepID=A0A2S0WQP4_9ACTN|nr:precorrin-6y C5,15-methyltransferase (decarboxylating) subunit CbiE [Aeromicrobium chenweiae]AWB93637.1 cobalamin biosynthesis bifunctional protein CbiET [Aeromicrobium chenweiae]TGN33287.1 precorrin-6y C5,15-methyltransferase (decarboxylating) subunit CbiE [Aeromicrobium chenweiae]
MSTRVTVVGIGADGWAGLTEAARALIDHAPVVLGGERHLAMLPDTPDQIRESWPSPLLEGLPALLEQLDGHEVVALASGDPLVSGVATTLVGLLGKEAVTIVPAVSSVALARARMRWSAESTEVVTLVGRDPHLVARSLAPGLRLIILSSDGSTPTEVAALLTAAGYGASRMSVLANLGSETESRLDGVAATWSQDSPALNVIAVELASSGATPLGFVAGLPDDAFEHDGQITKRDVRASALARLAPVPGQLLWDVGAGAGSVGIEWLRAHPTCRAIAVEAKDERAERIGRNAAALGVPVLQVVTGQAPGALDGLERPHAIFVGGGATEPGLVEACWEALLPGGRLVIHGVTLETEALLAERYARLGGELTRLHVEHAAPIGRFTGWTPARAVMQWAVTKADA